MIWLMLKLFFMKKKKKKKKGPKRCRKTQMEFKSKLSSISAADNII